ncbi:putative HAD superfamily protein [Acrodontium crateriforme]|uniref:HAD superfamily protein n=1 Tax=Acrodontium crateriforme TaxID=150365 RepID=A0AAQ3R994_9PEZI|nr:putative HAD superfamily protein [Acrodontium crateriforme]
MAKRNLLLCFDAFGTLFKPKYHIAQQYSDVARSLGMNGFSNEAVENSFRAAFKRETKENPNYGKLQGMNASQWWTNIIHNTFKPLIGSSQKINAELAPRLIERFSSDEGYLLFPHVTRLIRQLPRTSHDASGRIVVGIITNSDDRVPDVLNALGLRVNPTRYGKSLTEENTSKTYDIDFSVMSYDVGHAKPDMRIFAAAEEMLSSSHHGRETDFSSWDKVYVGDEFKNDVLGALEAGWNAVLIDRETPGKNRDVTWLDGGEPGDLLTMFGTSKAVGFSSLANLAKWLPEK